MLHGELVACNYFQVLGRNPRLGRGFSNENCRSTGAGTVVVLSDSLWRSKFAADPSILGRAITLSRHKFTVIGIAPPGFGGKFMVAAEFWVPIAAQPFMIPQIDWRDPNMSWLILLGRLKPGIAAEAARSDLQRIASYIDKSQSGRKTTLNVDIASLLSEPDMRKQVLTAGAVVLAGVSLVLLIACANVANLLLARASHRRREIAVRLSLGAGRARLINQLLTESLLISLAGGLLGTLLAHFIFRILLIAAGLLGRGLIAAQNRSPGFTSRNVVTASLDLRRDGYTKPQAAEFCDRLMARLEANPAVSAVSLAHVVPLSGSRSGEPTEIEGRRTPMLVFSNEVSPSFFHEPISPSCAAAPSPNLRMMKPTPLSSSLKQRPGFSGRASTRLARRFVSTALRLCPKSLASPKMSTRPISLSPISRSSTAPASDLN